MRGLFTVMLAVFFLLTAAIIIYLAKRISTLSPVKKLTSEKKGTHFLLSLGAFAVLFAILTLSMSVLNAVICFLHLALFFLLCDFVLFIIRKITKKGVSKEISAVLATVLCFSYLTIGYYNAHSPVATEYSFDTKKNVSPLRIVQISDCHVGTLFDAQDFLEYITEINEVLPDVVVITGDFIDDSTKREDLFGAARALGGLEAPKGVYFVFGNHDRGYFSEEERGWTVGELKGALEENGVTVLEDETVSIDGGYCLIGRRDLSFDNFGEKRETMASLTEGLDRELYSIVLDHQPSDYDAQAQSEVDLVLSGHTHGGQMLPINRVGELMGVNCRTYGHERRQNTDFIVNSGIGSWEIQFKTGCFSEYVIIDIK